MISVTAASLNRTGEPCLLDRLHDGVARLVALQSAERRDVKHPFGKRAGFD
jgi:hypothetical protein